MDNDGVLLNVLRSLLSRSTKYFLKNINYYPEFEHFLRSNLHKYMAAVYGGDWEDVLADIMDKQGISIRKTIRYMTLGDLGRIYAIAISQNNVTKQCNIDETELYIVMAEMARFRNMLAHSGAMSLDLKEHFDFFKRLIPVKQCVQQLVAKSSEKFA